MHCMYWFFSTHLFLILWCLSANSVITNIHIFLSLSYSFLLVASWCLSYSVDIVTVGKSKCSFALTEVLYLYDFEKFGTFGIINHILWYMGSDVFTNPLNRDCLGKTRTNEICMLWEPQIWHLSLKCWYHHTRPSLHSLQVLHNLQGCHWLIVCWMSHQMLVLPLILCT